MEKLKTFLITSDFIKRLHIPLEANLAYLKETDTEVTRKKIETHLPTTDFFTQGVNVTIEEIDPPFPEFNKNLFEEPNIKLLCYLGFSYPRYFHSREIYYGCYELYEFGGWGKNENRYYSTDGMYLKTESIN